MQVNDGELELEIEDIESSYKPLSKDFYEDDVQDFGVSVSLTTLDKENENSLPGDNFNVPVVSEDGKVKTITSNIYNLFVESLDNKTPEQKQKAIKEYVFKYSMKLGESLNAIKSGLKFIDTTSKQTGAEAIIRSSDKFDEYGYIITQALMMNFDVDAETAFKNSELSQTNDAVRLEFIKAFNSVRQDLVTHNENLAYLKRINDKSSATLLLNILDYKKFERLVGYRGEVNIVRKFYETEGLVSHFKCEACSTETEPHLEPVDNFIYVINLNGEDRSVVLPLECKKCGNFSFIDKHVLTNILSKCKKISVNLKTINNSNRSKAGDTGIMQIGVYTPNLEELTKMLEKYNMESSVNLDNLVDIDLDSIDLLGEEKDSDDVNNANLTLDKIDDDWENIKRRFFETITMIGESKFRLYGRSGKAQTKVLIDEEGNTRVELTNNLLDVLNPKEPSFIDDHRLHNITKIFANTHSDYDYLKGMALASALNLLKPLGLTRFSLTSKSSYKVYSLVGDLKSLGKTQLEFLSNELGYRLYNEDGSLDEKISGDLFGDINHMHNNFEEEKSAFIRSLYNNLYFLSYMPISAHKLLEADVNDYFYDEEIKKFLDRVSDLMILNSLAEEWFNRFNPAQTGGNNSMKIEVKKSILSTIKKMKAVNRKKAISFLFSKITNQIYPMRNVESIVHFLDSIDSINNIASFLEACRKKDLYEMYRSHSKIKWDYAPTYYPEFNLLSHFISKFPSQGVDSDKFKFYFKNLEVEDRFKYRFVSLFEKKGFIPRKFEGETVEEKLTYYESLNHCDDVVNYMPSEVESLLSSHKDVIKFGSFISYSGLFKDFGVYYSARDLLYYTTLKDDSMDVVLDMLNLDPTIASLLIEDDYELAKADDLVVKYIDLLNLPLDDSIEFPNETKVDASGKVEFNKERQKDRILFLLENYDDVKPIFKDFPDLYNLVLSIIGEI